ncbi:MAG: DUF1311 domain-containing protein [Acidobacteria bacterium]|nr:DUF1311 domain-containing protein [Acidobacteriota bacterium]
MTSQLSGFGIEVQEKLRKAQSLWLEYRDATCASEASHVTGGSLYPLIHHTCLASVTKERTKRLKAFLTEMRNL